MWNRKQWKLMYIGNEYSMVILKDSRSCLNISIDLCFSADYLMLLNENKTIPL